MKLKLEQTYNNIYPFYESARQARTERRERNKEKKKENALKRIKIREDCLKKAVVTKDSYIGTKEPMSWSERGIKELDIIHFLLIEEICHSRYAESLPIVKYLNLSNLQ